jgi:hypothetical protein
MKNLYKLKSQPAWVIALSTLPMLALAFYAGAPTAQAEPLIERTGTTVIPSNSKGISSQTDTSPAQGQRLTPHKFYKGASPGSDGSAEESSTGTSSTKEAIGTSTIIRNGATGVGTGTTYRNEPIGTGTSYRDGTSDTDTSGSRTSDTGSTSTGTSNTGTSSTGATNTGTSSPGTSGGGNSAR